MVTLANIIMCWHMSTICIYIAFTYVNIIPITHVKDKQPLRAHEESVKNIQSWGFTSSLGRWIPSCGFIWVRISHTLVHIDAYSQEKFVSMCKSVKVGFLNTMGGGRV